MISSFEEWHHRFSLFLKENGYPQRIEWITPQDMLLTGERSILIRTPMAQGNEENVRQLFEEGLRGGRGIVFETICTIGPTTYAYAWVPSNALEAERSMVGDCSKMSARQGSSRLTGKVIQNELQWLLLKFWYRNRQAQKQDLFRAETKTLDSKDSAF